MNSKLKKCNNFGKQSDFLNMGKKLETEIDVLEDVLDMDMNRSNDIYNYVGKFLPTKSYF